MRRPTGARSTARSVAVRRRDDDDLAGDGARLGEGECGTCLGQREPGGDLGGEHAAREQRQHRGQVVAQPAPEGVDADAVALWLGLHGLAHQKSVTVSFPWPADIAERLIVALAHLTGGRG